MRCVLAGAVCLVLAVSGCSDAETDDAPTFVEVLAKKEKEQQGERIYGPIEPVMVALPPDVQKPLQPHAYDGSPIVEVSVYFEIFSLPVYRDAWDMQEYIKDASAAFAAMSRHPEFAQAARHWDIQIQDRTSGKFINYAVTPEQAEEYARTGDLEQLWTTAEYVMVNDVIVTDPEIRRKYLRGELE